MTILPDTDTAFIVMVMGKDTVPLQYIKMPAAPKYYLGMKMQDNSDLGDLYEEAVKFFSVGSGSGSVTTSTNNAASDPPATAAAARVSPFGVVPGAVTIAEDFLLVV